MYILLNSLDLPKGEYGFQVIYQIGNMCGRWVQPAVTNCNSARSAMSHANGIVCGMTHMGGPRIEILKTPTFQAQFDAEMKNSE